MSDEVQLGFVLETLTLPLTQILPSRKIPPEISDTRKYKQIKASIEEVGLIEPLSLAPKQKKLDHYLLLDGHIRIMVLKELGCTEVPCLIAKDDEGFTFNARVNRLSTIQEHYMIKRAIERGVPKERLAKSLAMDLGHMNKKITLLDGICPEAVELLGDRQFSPNISILIRKMKPTRQIEAVELMIAANNVTVSYAEALVVATPPELLVDGKKPDKMHGVGKDDMLKMEREMASVLGNYKVIEQSYSKDIMILVVAQKYLIKLLGNTHVSKHLKTRHPEIMDQFKSIVEMTSLDGSRMSERTM